MSISAIRSVCLCSFTAGLVAAQQSAPQTLKGVTAAPGLEVTLWASEPLFTNPTNIDIDERGRIWVLEGVNYRRKLMGLKDYRAGGDRIVILEDTNHDGRADRVKVFAQDASLRSPLGIAVLGNRVIVSQSPDLIVYTKDEDDRIVKKEVLLTGWRGVDHDHGLHAVVFGHDGRYYFNSGDQGFDVTDRSGNRFASSRQGPYYAGAALRVNPDGTGFTVLGHNFRNPYELALDSFGNIWQTDNDDDGNAWTRVNYVMPGGNFGYWGPGGRSWHEDKGSHFHSELPGVAPNIARMGAGSPCGLVVYEGKLLPERYRGQLLHAEAGKRIIATYFLAPDGAGYSLKSENTVSAADMWFRPSDVAVAPDGAVYFSDWYDASVGGHQMRDILRGRIYRLAPRGYKPSPVRLDLNEALGSPAQSVRYLAYTRLRERGAEALPALLAMTQRGDPVLRARALWLLGGIRPEGERAVREALRDPDPNFRILAIRVLQLHGAGMVEVTRPLLGDPSSHVRREIAITLRDVRSDAALDSIIALAKQYDGKDRWYLEALGIAARGRENALYSKWKPPPGDLLWELRPSDALPFLVSSVRGAARPLADRAQALRTLIAMPSLDAGQAVLDFIGDSAAPSELVAQAIGNLNRRLFSEWSDLRKDQRIAAAVKKALRTPQLYAAGLELADDLEDPRYAPDLLALARTETAPEELRAAAIEALGKTRDPESAPRLEMLVYRGPVPLRVRAVRALGYARPKDLEPSLRKLILSQEPNEVRSEAVRVLGRGERGVAMLLDLRQSGELPSELKNVATAAVNATRNPALKARAAKLLPPLVARGKTPLPSPQKIVSEQGDPAAGHKVFFASSGPKCGSCHTVNGQGRSIGPDLSAIGNKLGKQALLDAILNPSAGIGHEYYVHILETRSQGEVIGILVEDTPRRVTVKNELGELTRVKPSDIKSRRRSNVSMMPEDLVSQMTEKQLVDLLEYLTTLKEAGVVAEAGRSRQ